jgi:hypothetical protein
VKVELKDVAAAVETAVASAREFPDEEASTIVNEIVGGLDETAGAINEPEASKLAIDYLHRSAGDIEALGETPTAPLVFALIGVGFALIANGQDAEAFYASQAEA